MGEQAPERMTGRARNPLLGYPYAERGGVAVLERMIE
jgi:hypothetical protein